MNPAAQAKGEVNRGNAAGLSGSKNTRHSRSLIDPMTSEAHALVYAALSWIAEDLDALAALESPAPARPADDEEIVEAISTAYIDGCGEDVDTDGMRAVLAALRERGSVIR